MTDSIHQPVQATCSPPDSSSSDHDLRLLLRRASNPLRNYLESHIPDSANPRIIADDVLQDVWVAAFKSSSLLTSLPEDEMMNWLYRVANRRLVSAIRFHMRKKRDATRENHAGDLTSSLVGLFEKIPSPERTPSSHASNNEIATEVRLAIDQLPEDTRRVIWLYHIEGLDRDEIGRRLEKTSGAIRGILYRGMIQLSGILRENRARGMPF